VVEGGGVTWQAIKEVSSSITGSNAVHGGQICEDGRDSPYLFVDHLLPLLAPQIRFLYKFNLVFYVAKQFKSRSKCNHNVTPQPFRARVSVLEGLRLVKMSIYVSNHWDFVCSVSTFVSRSWHQIRENAQGLILGDTYVLGLNRTPSKGSNFNFIYWAGINIEASVHSKVGLVYQKLEDLKTL